MKKIYVSILLFVVSLTGEESFVVHNKKPVATSGVAVKEDFVYASADLLQQIGSLQENLGRLQKEIVVDILDIVEGTNIGSLAKQKKMSVKQKTLDAIRQITLKIDELNRLLEQCQKALIF